MYYTLLLADLLFVRIMLLYKLWRLGFLIAYAFKNIHLCNELIFFIHDFTENFKNFCFFGLDFRVFYVKTFSFFFFFISS